MFSQGMTDAEYLCLFVCLYVSMSVLSVSGTRQMFSQGMADVLLDACSDFWDGHDIRPLGNEERYKFCQVEIQLY